MTPLVGAWAGFVALGCAAFGGTFDGDAGAFDDFDADFDADFG